MRQDSKCYHITKPNEIDVRPHHNPDLRPQPQPLKKKKLKKTERPKSPKAQTPNTPHACSPKPNIQNPDPLQPQENPPSTRHPPTHQTSTVTSQPPKVTHPTNHTPRPNPQLPPTSTQVPLLLLLRHASRGPSTPHTLQAPKIAAQESEGADGEEEGGKVDDDGNFQDGGEGGEEV
ncbi:hypothetical protein BP5796_11309 [Coleophoma crateriformis]|uniref:Uncharacterized protein n=1 Tax=Coleophoma crateriformis TaxID=565419 RepID=A0A3D8QI53_9HELO|nr:hypothetical protein BP5796_11309 [Coleophoma crateriformis]